eukprot:95635-Hanusia_phi.AAC.3
MSVRIDSLRLDWRSRAMACWQDVEKGVGEKKRRGGEGLTTRGRVELRPKRRKGEVGDGRGRRGQLEQPALSIPAIDFSSPLVRAPPAF